MSIFAFFRKKPAIEEVVIDEGQPLPHIDEKEHLLKIAGILCNGDEEILEEYRQALHHTADYLEAHPKICEDRGIAPGELDITPTFVQWIVLIDLLIQHKYLCTELDYKAELGDFYYFLKDTYWFKQFGLSFDGTELKEYEDLPKWCAQLDEVWKDQGICLVHLDIDSDSYVITPLKKAAFSAIQLHARQAGRHVKLAKEA